ncbi:hypothetical protein C0989_002321 [Termitomyces sp. Mn162]|nr:hypothetical protein C0989_002321 [Termitomyces sp. Mn162]
MVSCSYSGRSSRSTGGKFAKKIAVKAASVWNARAFVERQWELAKKGVPIEVKHLSLNLPTSQKGVMAGGSGVAKGKSKEVVESNDKEGNKDGNNGSNNDGDDYNVPLAQKHPASLVSVASAKRPRMVASKEGKVEDVEMEETTLLATVTEVEPVVSDMEVKSKEEEFEAEEEGPEEAKVR